MRNILCFFMDKLFKFSFSSLWTIYIPGVGKGSEGSKNTEDDFGSSRVGLPFVCSGCADIQCSLLRGCRRHESRGRHGDDVIHRFRDVNQGSRLLTQCDGDGGCDGNGDGDCDSSALLTGSMVMMMVMAMGLLLAAAFLLLAFAFYD